MSKIITNKIAYFDNSKIYEMKGLVLDTDLSQYFESIREINFENYFYESSAFNNGNVEIVDSRRPFSENTLRNSEDVKLTLDALSKQGIMNFKPITELLKSNSMMNNPKLIETLQQFVDLYSFEVEGSYRNEELNSLIRSAMMFGEDDRDLNALVDSINYNTSFFKTIARNPRTK